MKFKFLFSALLVFALTFSLAQGQNYIKDMNFLGGGARALGMGGAYFGISDEPSAALWNPAGLTQISKPQTDFSFYFYRPEIKYSTALETSSDSVYGRPYSFPGETYSEKYNETKSKLPFASVAIPFKISQQQFVGGVSFQRVSEIYDNHILKIIDFKTEGSLGHLDSVPYLTDRVENLFGSLNAISLSLAGKVIQGFSLGATLNIYGGNYTYNAYQYVQLGRDSIPGYPDDTTKSGNDSLLYLHPLIKADFSGVSINLGAMYEWQKLRIGAVAKLPYTLKEKQDVQYLADIIYDHPPAAYYSDALREYPFALLFTDRKWKIPFFYGLGASYQPIQNLTLAADIEFRDFSKIKLSYQATPFLTDTTDTVPYDPNTPFKEVKMGDWQKTTQFRIGGEYVINTKYGNIPLRAGYRNDPKYFTESENDTTYINRFARQVNKKGTGKKINGNVFSFGTGIAWKQISLDVCFELAKYENKTSGEVGSQYRDYPAVPDVNRFLLKPFERTEKFQDRKIIFQFTGFF
jgi:long-subunit fatty acid transport protein